MLVSDKHADNPPSGGHSYRMKAILLAVFSVYCSVYSTTLSIAQSPALVDAVYDPQIHTVLLYPQVGTDPGNPSLTLNPPIIPVDGQMPLQLEFDDLTGQYRSFRAKILHCNADWQRSVLNDIEFTYEYNDNPITEYSNSLNTKIPYFHYRFTLPRLKLPGNYLLVVYDERNPRNLITTRRFSTYANRLTVTPVIHFSNEPSRQFQDQQIDLSIDYQGYPVISPQDDFRVVIRQNYRDDRVITNLKPSNVRIFDQVLDYRPIDLSNVFPGGNEYRFFDLRSVISPGNYVQSIDRRADRNTAYLQTDGPRSRVAYVQFDDFDGQYVIDQRETGDGATGADYVETVFSLRVQELPNADLYVNGAFNLWQLNERNHMTYDPASNAYRAGILLKQGVYNYNYSATGVAMPQHRAQLSPSAGNETLVEGDFSPTENDYEVFVYHRPPASRADQLVAYRKVGVNKRN